MTRFFQVKINSLVKGIFTFLFISCFWPASGQSSQNQSEKHQPSVGSPQVKTSHSFDDYLVQGKFQLNEQTLITVEEDKALSGLIDLPKDFKNRMKEIR